MHSFDAWQRLRTFRRKQGKWCVCRSTEVVATLYLMFHSLTMVVIKLYNVKKESKHLKEGKVRNTTFQEQTVRMYRLCNLLLHYGLNLPANDSNLLILASHRDLDCNRGCNRTQSTTECFNERISVASSLSLSVNTTRFRFYITR